MSTIDTNSDPAAKEAAAVAVEQARDVSSKILSAVAGLDRKRLAYLAALAIVVLTTILFNMASFTVATEHAVSETTAQAQRVAEAKLNSWSYSAFTSTMWGKLMWLAAVAGMCLVVYEAVTQARAAWIPLAQIGCAALTTLLLMLLFVVGFPDLSAYSDANTSATLLGYWLPSAAAATATACSVKRLI